MLEEVVFVFDRGFLIQLKGTTFNRFKFKLFGYNSAPIPIIHFEACIPSLAARLFVEWTAFRYDYVCGVVYGKLTITQYIGEKVKYTASML